MCPQWEQGDIAGSTTILYEALHVATTIGAVPLVLEALAGIARLRAHEGHAEQAAELLGLALYHPAASTDLQIQIEPVLAELATKLPLEHLSAALTRGKTQDLELVAATIVGTPALPLAA